jgi:hypothetical protein
MLREYGRAWTKSAYEYIRAQEKLESAQGDLNLS